MVKVTCHKCGYEWDTASELIKVSCPSCSSKVDKENGIIASGARVVKVVKEVKKK